MNKINESVLLIKNLFVKHQPFILFSIIALGIPVLLSYVPYVNLVYTLDKGMLIYLLMVLIFVRPPAKFLLTLGIVLLFLALILLLLGFAILAEQVGNMIFFLIVIGVFSIISAHLTRSSND